MIPKFDRGRKVPLRDHYRFLAPIYEKLASLVFGSALVSAHRDLIVHGRDALAHCTQIIWIGGGTGVLIEELLKVAPQATLIYIEPSRAMLKIAKDRVHTLAYNDRERIIWVNETHDWLYHQTADSILHRSSPHDPIGFHRRCFFTAFFMDVLSFKQCQELMKWSRTHQVDTWLFADFIIQQRWIKKLFVQWMYICFMITTQIKQTSLLNHLMIFREQGWLTLRRSETLRARGLVLSALLTRK
jgi:tRNA (cmo5U34)-methyltransferase